MSEELWACNRCGSTYVQSKAWVWMNSKTFDEFLIVGDGEDDWCGACRGETTADTYPASEFQKCGNCDGEFLSEKLMEHVVECASEESK